METFQINYAEFEGRLDPFFYRPAFHSIKNFLESSKYAIKSIFELSTFVTDGIHKTPKYSENGLPFIQVNNIKEGIIDFDQNIKYVTNDWEQIALKRYSSKPGDILITKDGTIGIAAMVPNESHRFSIFVSVAAIRPKKELIIPKFLEIMINSPIVQNQIYRQTRGAVLVHLLLEEIRKLLIPLPPFEIQKKIVSLMETAYNAKKQNEEKAKKLYDSVDNYLLSELGINKINFEIEDIYFIDSIRLKYMRIDPFYHQPIFEKNDNSIFNGKFKVSHLNQLSSLITSGQRPKGGVRHITEGIPSLGGEHINSLGFIAQTELRYIPIEFHEAHLDSRVFSKDILLIKDGATTGKVGFIPENYPFTEANINEHLFLIRIKKEFDPFFIFCFLKSSVAQIQIKREITGATITGLVRDSVDKLLIPVPSTKDQERISIEIKNRIEKAEMLKEEGKGLIEQIKKQLEEIISK